MVMSDFWAKVDAQLAECRTARTAGDVLRILAQDRNPYGRGTGSAPAFFAGSGGDNSLWAALAAAGWSVIWAEADYHYAMRAPDGSAITYVEGDIYEGSRR